jgi:hypothetical protein
VAHFQTSEALPSLEVFNPVKSLKQAGWISDTLQSQRLLGNDGDEEKDKWRALGHGGSGRLLVFFGPNGLLFEVPDDE